jgi:large repetitive protein
LTRTIHRLLPVLLCALLLAGGTLGQIVLTAEPASAATPVNAINISSNHLASKFGQSVTFTVSISGDPATPSGTVDVLDGVTTLCANQTLVELAPTFAFATCTTSTLAVGTHPVTASYSGDLNHDPAVSTDFAPPTSQVVTAAATTTTLGSGTNPSVFSGSVTFNATVLATAPGAGTPSGTVTFTADGIDIAGCVGQPLAGGASTCTTTGLTVGDHPVIATYAGSTSFTASGSAPTVQTVGIAATTTAVVSDGSPSIWTDAVVLTATMTSTAPATATPSGGSVRFTVQGMTIAGCTEQPLSAGAATCTTTAIPVGAGVIGAVYSGGTSFSSSSSPDLVQVVSPAPTTTAVTSTHNPSRSGQSVTFTATISARAGTPTGTVTFFFVRSDGTRTRLATQTLSGGSATATTATLPVTFGAISVEYGGSAMYAPSATTNSQTVYRSFSTMTLAASSNPSIAGRPLTIRAVVRSMGVGRGTPTGKVAFYRIRPNRSRQWIGTGHLRAGVAVISSSKTPVGAHTFIGEYRGGANHRPSVRSRTHRVVAS